MSAAALANVQLASRAAAAVQHRSRELEERLMKVEVAMANRPDISGLMLTVGELKAEDAAILEKLSGNLITQSHAGPLPNSELPAPADRASDVFVSYNGRIVGDDHHTDIMTIDEAKGFAISDPEIKGFMMLKGNQIAATTTFKTEWKLIPDENYVSYAKGNVACGCNSSYCTPGVRSWSCCGMRNEFSDCTTSAHGAHWGQYRLHSINGTGSGGQCLINTLLPNPVVSVDNNNSSTPPRTAITAVDVEEIPPPVAAEDVLLSRGTHSPPHSIVSQIESPRKSVISQSSPDDFQYANPSNPTTKQPSVSHSSQSVNLQHNYSQPLQSQPVPEQRSSQPVPSLSVPIPSMQSQPVQPQSVESPPAMNIHSSPQNPYLAAPAPSPAPSRNYSEEQTNLEWDRHLQLARDGAAKVHSRATVRAQSVLPDTLVDVPGDDVILRREPSVVSPPAVNFRGIGSPGRSAWRGGSRGAEAFWRARSERGTGGGIGSGQTPATEHDTVTRRLWKELERAGVDVSQLAVSIAEDLGTTLPPPTSPEAFNPPVVHELPPPVPNYGEAVVQPPIIQPDVGQSSEILKQLQTLQATVTNLTNKVDYKHEHIHDHVSMTSSSPPPTPNDDGLNRKHGPQAIRIMLRSGPLTEQQAVFFLERLCGSLLLPMGSIRALPRIPGCDLRIFFKSPSSHHQMRMGMGFVEQCNSSPANPLLESLGILKAYLETDEVANEQAVVSLGTKPRRRVAACIPPTPVEQRLAPRSSRNVAAPVVSMSAPSVEFPVYERDNEISSVTKDSFDTIPTVATQHLPRHSAVTDVRIPAAPYAASPSQHLENAQNLLSMWDNADVYRQRSS